MRARATPRPTSRRSRLTSAPQRVQLGPRDRHHLRRFHGHAQLSPLATVMVKPNSDPRPPQAPTVLTAATRCARRVPVRTAKRVSPSPDAVRPGPTNLGAWRAGDQGVRWLPIPAVLSLDDSSSADFAVPRPIDVLGLWRSRDCCDGNRMGTPVPCTSDPVPSPLIPLDP
jgi:hypothetical protein